MKTNNTLYQSASETGRRAFWLWLVFTTVAAEAVTVFCSMALGHSAAEFNATNPPWLLQIHHMFWSVPFYPMAIVLRRRAVLAGSLCGLATGFVVSDLAHHFIVLPLWQGNTGWHWP